MAGSCELSLGITTVYPVTTVFVKARVGSNFRPVVHNSKAFRPRSVEPLLQKLSSAPWGKMLCHDTMVVSYDEV